MDHVLAIDVLGTTLGTTLGSVGAEPDIVAALPRFAGRLHPALVHFPIALIIAAGVIELVSAPFRRNGAVSRAAVACLALGALGAVAAAWCGWLNADHESHGSAVATTLLTHRWIGISAASAAVLGALFALAASSRSWHFAVNGYRACLFFAMLLVSVGAYLGGELTYGEGYLFEVFRDGTRTPESSRLATDADAADGAGSASASATAPTPDPARDVQEIFDARCVRCHGERRQKAGIRLDSMAHVFAEDNAEWMIIPGDAAGSALYRRVTLPEDDDDRMPAEGDPLTVAQIATIKAWIDAGAPHGDVPSASEPIAAAPP